MKIITINLDYITIELTNQCHLVIKGSFESFFDKLINSEPVVCKIIWPEGDNEPLCDVIEDIRASDIGLNTDISTVEDLVDKMFDKMFIHGKKMYIKMENFCVARFDIDVKVKELVDILVVRVSQMEKTILSIVDGMEVLINENKRLNNLVRKNYNNQLLIKYQTHNPRLYNGMILLNYRASFESLTCQGFFGPYKIFPNLEDNVVIDTLTVYDAWFELNSRYSILPKHKIERTNDNFPDLSKLDKQYHITSNNHAYILQKIAKYIISQSWKNLNRLLIEDQTNEVHNKINGRRLIHQDAQDESDKYSKNYTLTIADKPWHDVLSDISFDEEQVNVLKKLSIIRLFTHEYINFTIESPGYSNFQMYKIKEADTSQFPFIDDAKVKFTSRYATKFTRNGKSVI
jgi:hypothetical protein